MHELTVATAMIERIGRAVIEAGARHVTRVTVDIGALCGIEADALSFCFPIAAQGTCADGAILDVMETPTSVRCRSCGDVGHPEPPAVYCVACGSTDVEVVAGRDFVIRTLEVS